MIDYRNNSSHKNLNILDMPSEDDLFNLAIFTLNIVVFQYNNFEVLCRELEDILFSNVLFCITMQDAIKRIETGIDP